MPILRRCNDFLRISILLSFCFGVRERPENPPTLFSKTPMTSTKSSDNFPPTPAYFPVTEDHVNMHLPNATASHALLLATLNDLSTPCFLAPAVAGAARCVRDRLVVILFSRLFNTGRRPRSPLSGHRENAKRNPSVDSSRSNSSTGVSHTGCWDDIQRLLTYVYVQATTVAQELDKVLL